MLHFLDVVDIRPDWREEVAEGLARSEPVEVVVGGCPENAQDEPVGLLFALS